MGGWVGGKWMVGWMDEKCLIGWIEQMIGWMNGEFINEYMCK